jgi:hypothetical protein
MIKIIYYAIAISLLLLTCSNHDRSNPFDPQGINWNPPVLTHVHDTTVSTTSTVRICVNAVIAKSGSAIKKYLWDIGANGWDDSTTEPAHNFADPAGGPMKIVWAAQNSEGIMIKDTFVIIFDRPPTNPLVTPGSWLSFDSSTAKGTVPLTLSASDPDLPYDTLTYTLFTGTSSGSLTQVYSGKTAQYNISNVDSNAYVYWQLKVRDLYGDSAVAEGAFNSAKPGPPPTTVPFTPTILSASASDGQVTIVWNSIPGATSYNLYYKAKYTVDTTSWFKLTGVISPKTIINLINGTEYMFNVSAVNIIGESDLSSVETAMPWGNITVTDIDGNVYNTVAIGTQVWMVENLRTTRYNDGTAIPLVTNDTTWSALKIPGYCWFFNDSARGSILYNWYAVETGKLAPKGWHVPSQTEWEELIRLMDGMCYEQQLGYRDDNSGQFKDSFGTCWWTSTPLLGDASQSWNYRCYAGLDRGYNVKSRGLSVKCIKD